jgi:4-hydroxybenzoate polyprenyltransferase
MDPVERGRRVSGRGTEASVVAFPRIDKPEVASQDPPELHALRLSNAHATNEERQIAAIVRAMRPAQWIKNGALFAGLIFGGRLFEPWAVGSALFAFFCFCLLSGGFYLVNDVRDAAADRAHPQKRLRPVASGALAADIAMRAGIGLIAFAIAAAGLLGLDFLMTTVAYTALMAAYNFGLKQIVIIDVLVIATGFVIRAAAGAVAVEVVISPWLLTCTMLVALLIGFGKRRYELTTLDDAVRHRRNLESYSRSLLDQAVAVTAAGTLVVYAVYTFDAESAPADHRMMLTIPIVAYGIFRYLHLLYRRGGGGAPETLLLTDCGMLVAVTSWGLISAMLFYLAG